MTNPRNPYLLMPWGLFSIIAILLLCMFNSNWMQHNWHWLVLVLIFPTAVLENLKTGFSSMRVMFLKVMYTLLSFLVVGVSIGFWVLNNYYREIKGIHVARIDIPYHVFLAIGVVLLIELANIFSLLKAVKREFGLPMERS